jgi:hypothetical protein
VKSGARTFETPDAKEVTMFRKSKTAGWKSALVLPVVAAALMSACGGSGGGEVVVDPPTGERPQPPRPANGGVQEKLDQALPAVRFALAFAGVSPASVEDPQQVLSCPAGGTYEFSGSEIRYSSCSFSEGTVFDGTVGSTGSGVTFNLQLTTPSDTLGVAGGIGFTTIGDEVVLNGRLDYVSSNGPSFSVSFVDLRGGVGGLTSGRIVIDGEFGRIEAVFDGSGTARVIADGVQYVVDLNTGQVDGGNGGGGGSCGANEKACGDGCIFVEDECCGSGEAYCRAPTVCPADLNDSCIVLPR